MVNSVINPRVALSQTGDVLIIQGPACPILFIPHAFVPGLLKAPESAIAITISDVGAAAIMTLLSADAIFDATTVIADPATIASVTLRFTLRNGLVVAYTTDDVLASSRESLKALGIDLVVTDSSIEWNRQHAQLVGDMISRVSTVPPQIAGLHQFEPQRLAKLIAEALDQQCGRSQNGESVS